MNHETAMKGRPLFERLDSHFIRITKYLSYASPVALTIMALLGTFNVILSKLFIMPIPGANYRIAYFLIIVVYFSISHVQLTKGLTSIDVITRFFPSILNRILKVIHDILGILVFGAFSYFGSMALQSNFHYKTLSESGSTGFLLWPYNLILVFFCGLMSLTYIWNIVRLFSSKEYRIC